MMISINKFKGIVEVEMRVMNFSWTILVLINPRINIWSKVMRPWWVMEIQDEKKWINGRNNNKYDV
jgi:hypothetical protein